MRRRYVRSNNGRFGSTKNRITLHGILKQMSLESLGYRTAVEESGIDIECMRGRLYKNSFPKTEQGLIDHLKAFGISLTDFIEEIEERGIRYEEVFPNNYGQQYDLFSKYLGLCLNVSDISARDLAKRAGISRNDIREYRYGHRRATEEVKTRIFDALDSYGGEWNRDDFEQFCKDSEAQKNNRKKFIRQMEKLGYQT